MKKLLLLGALLLLALLPVQAQDGFDRHALLQSLVDNVILPGYQDFVTASDELAISLNNLAANPSLEALGAAQRAWRNASDSWEEISFMSINIELMALHNHPLAISNLYYS